MADLPHFVLPFRVANGAAVVVEQDTTDDVLVCVLAILLCPLGYRAELPDFGIDDPTFSEGFVDLESITRTLAEWEPRADALMTQQVDSMDDLVRYVSMLLSTRSHD